MFAIPNQPALLIHTKKDAFIYTGLTKAKRFEFE